jgi:hypothetical protein
MAQNQNSPNIYVSCGTKPQQYRTDHGSATQREESVRRVHVTKMAGSSSDDWILLSLQLQPL